jgi:paired amphipathic helix protein Sin3a
MEIFLDAFIPLLCMYLPVAFNAVCGPLEGSHEDDLAHDLNRFLRNPEVAGGLLGVCI